jgi:hypothetical protein
MAANNRAAVSEARPANGASFLFSAPMLLGLALQQLARSGS